MMVDSHTKLEDVADLPLHQPARSTEGSSFLLAHALPIVRITVLWQLVSKERYYTSVSAVPYEHPNECWTDAFVAT